MFLEPVLLRLLIWDLPYVNKFWIYNLNVMESRVDRWVAERLQEMICILATLAKYGDSPQCWIKWVQLAKLGNSSPARHIQYWEKLAGKINSFHSFLTFNKLKILKDYKSFIWKTNCSL